MRRRVDHKDFIFFTYKELFPYYMDFLPKVEEFKREIRSENPFFEELLRQTVEYDVEYFALDIIGCQGGSGCDERMSSRAGGLS